jgi:hypothetical protein
MSSCSGSLIATPLLALFNEASLAKGAETIEEVRREQEQLEAQRRLQIADQRGRPPRHGKDEAPVRTSAHECQQ